MGGGKVCFFFQKNEENPPQKILKGGGGTGGERWSGQVTRCAAGRGPPPLPSGALLPHAPPALGSREGDRAGREGAWGSLEAAGPVPPRLGLRLTARGSQRAGGGGGGAGGAGPGSGAAAEPPPGRHLGSPSARRRWRPRPPSPTLLAQGRGRARPPLGPRCLALGLAAGPGWTAAGANSGSAFPALFLAPPPAQLRGSSGTFLAPRGAEDGQSSAQPPRPLHPWARRYGCAGTLLCLAPVLWL